MKKKINGYLKLLLALLFSMVLNTFSTCYASTPANELDVETANNLFEKIREVNSKSNYPSSTITNFLNNVNVENFVNYWNSNINLTKFPFLEQIVISVYDNRIILAQNNNGYDNNLPHLKIGISDYSGFNYLAVSSYYISQNDSYVAGSYYEITTNTSGTFTFSLKNLSVGSSVLMNDLNRKYPVETYTQGTINGYIVPCIISFVPSSIYLREKDSASYKWTFNFNIAEIYEEPTPTPIPIVTPTPIPDVTPTPTGNKDYTQDLSNINQSINNQGQAIVNNQNENTDKIIQNQNQNTQATVNAINNANENYWGGEEDLNEEEHNQEIEGNVNDLMENVSGELAKNEVVKMLDEAEKGFIAKFQKGLAEEAYDLKFEWPDIKYEGLTLIEAGELNISKICRENETMGVVKGYIQVIATFTVVMNILGTIYNMILHALGVSHPELTVKFDEPVQNDKMLGPGPDDNGTIHL